MTTEHGGYGDNKWRVPEVFGSRDQYALIMSHWVDKEAEREEQMAPIQDVDVNISPETNEGWCGRFRNLKQFEFRPQQQVTVARRFRAVVATVNDSDVTVAFQEDEKFDAWVEDRGTRVGCEITTEGRTIDVSLEISQGIDTAVWHASFKVRDEYLHDIKPGGCLKFRPKSKKDKECLSGTILSLGIDNRVCVRLEAGPKDRLEKSGKYDIELTGSMPSQHVQRALRLFKMNDPLFAVRVKVEQRASGQKSSRWYGTFQGKGDLIEHSEVGDRLFLTKAGTMDVYIAKVTSKRKRTIAEVKFYRDFGDVIESGVIEMDIYPKECVLQDPELTLQDPRSLDPDMVGPSTTTTQEIKQLWLGKAPEKRYSPCTIGDTIGEPHIRYWRARPLSASQKEAVEVAMSQPLTIIQGPTGTGKTTCVAAYVWNTVKKHPDSKVLVTAPSKSALDQIVEYLVRAELDVVRMQSRAEAIGPEPTLSHVKPALLREKVKRLLKNTEEAKGVLADRGLFQSEIGLKALENSVKDGTMLREYRKQYNCLCGHILSHAKVICCTLTMAGNSLMRKIPFEYVVIDEATRVVEPQALVAVMHGSKQVVLVGDPMQLWPIVNCPDAERYGYSSSIIHRLVCRAQSQEPWLLKTQYRMHPAIAQFPIGLFYSESIQNGVTEASMRADSKTLFDWPDLSQPLMVLHTEGNEKGNVNVEEANTIIRILQNSYARNVQGTSIGVILLYNAQKLYLRSRLSKLSESDSAFREWCNQLSIDTVDGFQGAERDFILISTVKREHVGQDSILADPKRMNVMLTRARWGVIIVGDIKLLSLVVGWQNLINDAKDRDLLWCMNTKNELTRCDPSLIYKGDPVASWKLDEIDDLRWVWDDLEDSES